MRKVDSVLGLREQIRAWREQMHEIALVPTMGNLHAGHLALVKHAKDIADRVVVSIFVNPTQFVAGEDYASYPRTLQKDSELLTDLGTDLVFTPGRDEMYPRGESNEITVTVPGLDNIFCGHYRPGHFVGVATVVTKLLNMSQPDIAVFGEKDYQQLLVIRALVDDLSIPVAVRGVPTVREKDGLAMSSRNVYLTDSERAVAASLYHQLTDTAARIKAGETDFPALEKNATTYLDEQGFQMQYFSVRRAADLGEPDNSDLVILAAGYLGRARLIDNIIIRR